jgi:hypothetical protein
MDNLGYAASIVGAITGTISLFIVIWGLAVWKGAIETKVKALDDCQEKYPPAELSVMVKTLWDVYIIGGLQNRPDLASHSSPYRLHDTTRDMIPANVKEILDTKVTSSVDGKVPCLGYQIVKAIGESPLIELSKSIGLSLQETISILVTYVSENMQAAGPGMVC